MKIVGMEDMELIKKIQSEYNKWCGNQQEIIGNFKSTEEMVEWVKKKSNPKLIEISMRLAQKKG